MARLKRGSPSRTIDAPAELRLELAGRAVPLRLRRDARARRLILRVDAIAEGAVVTLPLGARVAEAVALAHRHAAWLMRRLKRLPPRVAFADGARVPWLGVDHVVRHHPEARRGVWRETGVINVSGASEHVARRLRDWLKAEARREIARRVAEAAHRVGRPAGNVSVGDARTLWGSCGRDGKLSFSWRLALAPAAILDYVVAHEVAHLVWRGHGPRFWGLVASLVGDTQTPRAWLRVHGEALHRYG